jgi:hypothetical protein
MEAPQRPRLSQPSQQAEPCLHSQLRQAFTAKGPQGTVWPRSRSRRSKGLPAGATGQVEATARDLVPTQYRIGLAASALLLPVTG